MADELLLKQIVNNLLSNAVKYSPLGGTVTLSVVCSLEEVMLQVRDQGIGITKHDQECLFEDFFRASNVGDIPGTGLGLAIVKQAVELHGGSITVQSEIGEGTTMTVYLPRELQAS
jgi:signal transduction histidine kinase